MRRDTRPENSLNDCLKHVFKSSTTEVLKSLEESRRVYNSFCESLRAPQGVLSSNRSVSMNLKCKLARERCNTRPENSLSQVCPNSFSYRVRTVSHFQQSSVLRKGSEYESAANQL